MVEELNKSTLAYLSGAGFMSVVLFFIFFMQPEKYGALYTKSLLLILMAALVVFFYLFDDLTAIVNYTAQKEDPEEFHTKVERATNFISAMILMGVVGLNLIVYKDMGGACSVRALIITLLTLASVFLLLYSMFME